MRKQILLSVVSILLLASTAIAQKSKSDKTVPQPTPSPQILLEQRLGELSKDISDELTDKQKTTVAVADFVDLKGNSSDFGKFLAEELVTRLYKTKKLKVIERQRLDKVIAEQKLSLTEIIEASSAKRIGRILGVDAIVAGTISELSTNFRINARIISTETGELLAAAGTTIAKDQEVCSLIDCGAKATPTSRVEPQAAPVLKSKSQPTGEPTFIRKDSNFFTFDLHQCRSSGTSVICDFTITNNDKDRLLRLHTAYMFDDSSNQFQSVRMRIASVEESQPIAFLVSGVPTKGRIIFEKVTSDATKITLLKLRCDIPIKGELIHFNNWVWFEIEYRNISLRE